MEAQVGTGRPQPLGNSLAALRRLKVLGSAGLISRGREAQWRPCGLETDQLQADGWLDRQRHFRAPEFRQDRNGLKRHLDEFQNRTYGRACVTGVQHGAQTGHRRGDRRRRLYRRRHRQAICHGRDSRSLWDVETARSSTPLLAEIEAAEGQAFGRSLDARQEDDIAAFLQEADRVAPLEVCIFNVGANVNFPLLETTERVFRKVWEMACYSGFLAGREAARLMLPRGKGAIFFTGATASLRGGIGYAAFAAAKFGLRAVAQSAARELGREISMWPIW